MKLKTGYLLSGTITALILLFSFIWTQPDGKLHVTFCDVGQGDAAYVRFPDGRDMVVDGGPNDKVIDCLGRHMPFWDREIDMVLLTHPQKDHLQGLIAVFERYKVGYFVRSQVENTTDGFEKLTELVRTKLVAQKFMGQGEDITVGSTTLQFFGPTANVLGASTMRDLNEYSLVFALRYGDFDALFTGDATLRDTITSQALGSIEVLKVPHHGSKTGMNQAFVDWVKPKLSIISVGKNSYGHPTREVLDMIQSVGSRIIRTDQAGDVEIISDGIGWKVK